MHYRTQIPHAVGAAYSLKMDGKNACSVTYFGDGGTSTVNTHFFHVMSVNYLIWTLISFSTLFCEPT